MSPIVSWARRAVARRAVPGRAVERPSVSIRPVEPLEGRTLFADTASPLAAINVGDVTAGGAASHDVVVVYTDDVAVDVSTIGPDDLAVVGRSGQALSVLSVAVSPPQSAATVTATYRVAPPGGVFDEEDNGSYTVTAIGGAVADTSGNPSPGATAGFVADIAKVEPQAPVASISVSDVSGGGGTELLQRGAAGAGGLGAVRSGDPTGRRCGPGGGVRAGRRPAGQRAGGRTGAGAGAG